MKNMATELCIILIGYFTLVPAIQVSQTSSPRQEVCLGESSPLLLLLLFPGVLSVCCRGVGV